MENQKEVIFMGAVAKHKFPTITILALWGLLQRYLSISCYDNIIFNFNFLYWEKFLKVINAI